MRYWVQGRYLSRGKNNFIVCDGNIFIVYTIISLDQDKGRCKHVPDCSVTHFVGVVKWEHAGYIVIVRKHVDNGRVGTGDEFAQNRFERMKHQEASVVFERKRIVL